MQSAEEDDRTLRAYAFKEQTMKQDRDSGIEVSSNSNHESVIVKSSPESKDVKVSVGEVGRQDEQVERKEGERDEEDGNDNSTHGKN